MNGPPSASTTHHDRLSWSLNNTQSSVGMWAGLLGPALPALAQGMGIGLDEAGILFTADSLGYLISVSIVGRALDVGNRQIILISGLMLMAVAIVLLPQAPLLPLAFALVLLIGLGAGTLVVGGSVVGGDLKPLGQASAINMLQAFYASGALLAPLLIRCFDKLLGSFRYAFWFLGSVLALGALALIAVPVPRADGAVHAQRSSPWGSLLKDRSFQLLLAFAFVYIGIGVGFQGWIFTYVRNGLGASDVWASATTSGFWAAIAVGRFLSSRVLRRLVAEKLMVIASFGSILAAALLISAQTPALTAIGTLMLGLAYAPMIPTAMGIGQANHPRAAGTAIGLINFAGAIGWMVIPWLEGKLMVMSGAWVFTAATFAANVLLLVLALAIGRERVR